LNKVANRQTTMTYPPW